MPVGQANLPVVERDPVIAALVARCGEITAEEAGRLASAWATVEDDHIASADVAEGHRQAGLDADEAADAADWAFRSTLGIPSDGALYADTDPFAGRAIKAIRAHATAVAARSTFSPALAAVMSGPWRAAIGPE